MDVIAVAENSTKEMSSLPQEWLISLKNPKHLWNDNWFALVVEVTLITLFALAGKNAMGKGLRSCCFLCSCFLAALGLELLQMIPHEGYQLWWYHQGMINVLQRRVPLYIVCFSSSLYYYVHCINERMNLPIFTQSLVNAIACSLVTFPCLALAPNFLMLLVHFDDPVFQHRLLNVPYAQMTYLFLLFFHMGHYFNSSYDAIGEQNRQTFRYILCSIESGFVSSVFSVVELYLIYMVEVNIFQLHPGLCLLTAFVVPCFMAREELSQIKSFNIRLVPSNLKGFFCLVFLFGLLISSATFVQPENLRSFGERLELGPCNEVHAISNMSPLETIRRKYVCTEDEPKFGFDFHCVSTRGHPDSIQKTYTICGAPLSPNMLSCLLCYTVPCLAVFYAMLSMSVTLIENLDVVQKEKKMF